MASGLSCPPLVWVPGHMCGPWLYAAQAGLWPGAEVHAGPWPETCLGAMAERLLAAAPDRFVLAGLSMGGMLAMEAMARAPDRLAGVLLMDTDPTPARARERAWRAGEMQDVRANGVAGYAARFSAKFYAHDRGVAARLGPATEARMAAVPAERVLAEAAALDTRRAAVPLIEGISAPVEVLVGAADRVCPPRLHPPVAVACRDARLTVVPGCGHIATLERPDAVAAALMRLAARVGA